MRIVIIGSGGREHALALCLKRTANPTALYALPGNPGIAAVADCVKMVRPDDVKAVVAFCKEAKIDLAVIGPEAPLVAGLVDALTEAGIAAFGPTKAAAILEGSKGFVKDLCTEYNIPTAAYGRFTDYKSAEAFIRKHRAPIVVKADGLAAGKGVVVAQTVPEALDAVQEMLSGRFGAAGESIVVEEFLEGEELSFFALCDGLNAVPFGAAQDHKRVGEGDTGPNTGGMGTYTPPKTYTPELRNEVMQKIIAPTVQAMVEKGMPYKGVFFAGLMLTKDGPKLLEYNVRFGDPETQSLLPLLKTNLAELMLACVKGKLAGKVVEMEQGAAMTVVMAAKGYPGEPLKGTEIKGLEKAASVPGVQVLHAGTKKQEGKIVADGGRVLNITATGKTIAEAKEKVYKAVDLVDWPEGFCRRDIGWRAL